MCLSAGLHDQPTESLLVPQLLRLGFFVVFGPLFFGALALVVLKYRGTIPQIMNDGTMFGDLQNRGRLGFVLGLVITAFYCALYSM